MKAFASLLAALLFTACATAPVAIQRHDLGRLPVAGEKGLPAYATQLPMALAIADVAMPNWLDTPGIVYRLTHRGGAPETYGNSRWVAAPSGLVTDRLRQRLTALGVLALAADGSRGGGPVLRIEIEEFTHEFTSDSDSQGVLIGRAVLNEGSKPPRMTPLRVIIPAASPDAQGGSRALATAANEAIERTLIWVAGGGVPAGR
jgi:cholesterol transport system auxiliary component